MSYLLDTCVVSELVARRPNPKVVRWIDSIDEACLYLSVITLGEIRKGIAKLADGERKSTLIEWLAEQLLVRFEGRIVPLDAEILLAWGNLTGALELVGAPMPAIDSLLAATALQRGLTLVTRNGADFQHAGVPILDPWA